MFRIESEIDISSFRFIDYYCKPIDYISLFLILILPTDIQTTEPNKRSVEKIPRSPDLRLIC